MILPSVWQMCRKREVSTGKTKNIQSMVEPRRVKNAKRHRLPTYLCTRSKVEFDPTDDVANDLKGMEVSTA